MSQEASSNPFLASTPVVRSLNRARVMVLDGAILEEELVGASGYDLLGTASLHRLILPAAAALGLDPEAPNLVRRFDACFADGATGETAELIARTYGSRLGTFLAMLKGGAPANRAARPEWSAAHWAFWRQVTQVVLGGGLLAGRLGPLAIAAAQARLAAVGVTDLALTHSPYGAALPLVGLARLAPPDTAQMLLFDFGQTRIKRGLARYVDGRLVGLERWAPAPTACSEVGGPAPSLAVVEERWREMRALIASAWAELPALQQRDTPVGLCLSCYLNGGHPAPEERTGCYGSLQLLTDHLASFIQHEVAASLPDAPPVAVLHDGAAAATAHAGLTHTVVLTLGTAIGNGFPPPAEGLRALDIRFTLTDTPNRSS